jgi:hypothetical protein
MRSLFNWDEAYFSGVLFKINPPETDKSLEYQQYAGRRSGALTGLVPVLQRGG